MVWFPIEVAGKVTDRYIHVGEVSHGCITIPPGVNGENWDKVYDYLINKRQDSKTSKYVGDLIVEK